MRIRQLHYVRSPKQPIQADIEPIRDLADAVKIERLKAADQEICGTAAAKADVTAHPIARHAPGPAGFRQALGENTEIGTHEPRMLRTRILLRALSRSLSAHAQLGPARLNLPGIVAR
jgi:hypothetical protein